jgi:hypothetical protein
MKLYRQCRLQRGSTQAFGWVETRGARIHASVELMPDREMWEVVEVFNDVTLREDQLREHQRLNRRSLPSIEAMA